MPWWLRVVRRLAREQVDLRDHNEYLTRVNGDLTRRNSELSVNDETLRWRVADLNEIIRKSRPDRYRLWQLERALTRIGTEDD